MFEAEGYWIFLAQISKTTRFYLDPGVGKLHELLQKSVNWMTRAGGGTLWFQASFAELCVLGRNLITQAHPGPSFIYQMKQNEKPVN